MEPLVAAVLSPAQQETVEFFRALNVPASWFIGELDTDGDVEVIAIGKDEGGTFVWSIRIDEAGAPHQMEAKVTEFSDGIDV